MHLTAKQIVALAEIIKDRGAAQDNLGASVLMAQGPQGDLWVSIESFTSTDAHDHILIGKTGTRIL